MAKNEFWQAYRVSQDPRPKPSTAHPVASDTTKTKNDSLETERRKAAVSVKAHVDSALNAPFTPGGDKEMRTHFKRADSAAARETELAEKVNKAKKKP